MSFMKSPLRHKGPTYLRGGSVELLRSRDGRAYDATCFRWTIPCDRPRLTAKPCGCIFSSTRHDDRRVSEEEAVAREAALEAAREEFSQQQTKAVANVRRKNGITVQVYSIVWTTTIAAGRFAHHTQSLACSRKPLLPTPAYRCTQSNVWLARALPRRAEMTQARAAATAEARVRAERDRASAVEAAKEREHLATEKVQEELRRYVRRSMSVGGWVGGLFLLFFQPDLALSLPFVSRLSSLGSPMYAEGSPRVRHLCSILCLSLYSSIYSLVVRPPLDGSPSRRRLTPRFCRKTVRRVIGAVAPGWAYKTPTSE